MNELLIALKNAIASNPLMPIKVTPEDVVNLVTSSKYMFYEDVLNTIAPEEIARPRFATEVLTNSDCYEGITKLKEKILVQLIDADVEIKVLTDPLACEWECEQATVDQVMMTPNYHYFCKTWSCPQILVWEANVIESWIRKVGQTALAKFDLEIAKARINALQTGIKNQASLDLSKKPEEIKADLLMQITEQLWKLKDPVFVWSWDLWAKMSTLSCMTECNIDGKNYRSINILNINIPIITSRFLAKDNAYILYDVTRLWYLRIQKTWKRRVLFATSAGENKVQRFDTLVIDGTMKSGHFYLLPPDIKGGDNGLIGKKTNGGEDQKNADEIKTKIEGMTGATLTLTPADNTQPSAQTAVQNAVLATAGNLNGLTLEYKFSAFTAATADTDGSITVIVEIKDASGTTLATSTAKTFILKYVAPSAVVLGVANEQVPAFNLNDLIEDLKIDLAEQFSIIVTKNNQELENKFNEKLKSINKKSEKKKSETEEVKTETK